jgi:hypothetical protein
MKVTNFLGINNIANTTRLTPGEMTAATNVDIGVRGKLLSRRGRALLRAGVASSVFEAPFGLFVLVGNDLLLLNPAGATIRTVYETLGYTRVWYTLLPDGRVAFSNGLIQGLASLTETTAWGIERPVDVGVGIAGDTSYQLTYTRLSDGLEGPPSYGEAIDPREAIIGLPAKAGHQLNVYLAPYGEEVFLAGTTMTDTFLWSGAQLGPEHTGHGLDAPPVGSLLHAWNSRVLIADGSTIWATRPMQPELCDLTKDFLQMPDPVTLMYGNGDGLFVGTTVGMYFLAGQVFEQLKAQPIAAGRVVLGSCVETNLNYLNEKIRPKGVLQGALCLLDGAIHLIFGGGEIIGLTTDRYRTDATEVQATIRLRDGVMHYLAAPV